MKKHHDAKKQKFENIKFSLHKITVKTKKDGNVATKKQDENQPVKRIKTKEEIYQEMKDKFRFAWKDPGYASSEFSKIPILKAVILNPWESERAFAPERSYKAPKDFRGMKTTNQGEEFGYPPESTLPKLYRDHLTEVKIKFQDFLQRPSKHGPIKQDIIMDNLFNKEQERNWRLVNSVQQKDFLSDKHATFEATLRSKRGSQSLIQTTMRNTSTMF